MLDVDAAIRESLKARDHAALTGYRSLKAKIATRLSEAGREQKSLSEPELEALIRREVKERRESNEFLRPGQPAYEENARIIAVLEAHLPRALSEEETAAAIAEAIAATGAQHPSHLGKVMAALRQVPGVDMKAASAKVREALARRHGAE